MKKRSIRCYRAYVYSGSAKYPVYYTVYEGWSNFILGTCINCGELFVVDLENPRTSGLGLEQIVRDNSCPNCNSLLENTIRPYPHTVRLPNGNLSTFFPTNFIPPDNESIIMDFFEIMPKLFPEQQ